MHRFSARGHRHFFSLGLNILHQGLENHERQSGSRISGKGFICIKMLGFALLIVSHFS